MQPSSPPPAFGGYPQPAMAVPQSNGSAQVSLVLGIIGLVVSWIPVVGLIGLILGIIGAVFGHRGFAQSRLIPPPKTGRGMAIAGLIMSYLALAISLAVTIFIIYDIVQITHTCQTEPAQCG
jgi:uncharacterized membrane protein